MGSVSAVMGKSGDFVNECMPTLAPVHCVRDIPYARWADDGVTTIVWDVEATFGVTGAKNLDLERLQAIEKARAAGICRHILSTNLAINDNKKENRYLLRGWEEQTGADMSLFPEESWQRKPSPYMLQYAMYVHELSPAQMGVVGDKATADIRAGYLAGVEHRAWTRPFGDNRHPGDRFLRGPLESVLRVQAHLALTPKLQKELGTDLASVIDLAKHQDKRHDCEDSLPDGEDKIVGLGIERVMLPPEILDTLRKPYYRQALESMKDTFDRYGELPAQYLKSFLYEHGRITADGLVLIRLMAALGIVAVNRSDLPADVKNKLSAGLTVAAYATDPIDGFAARRHKHGATAKGGAYDQNVDKLLSAIIDVFPLLRRGLISKPDMIITVGRELGLTVLRRPFKQRGISTSSVDSGKLATDIKAAAQIFGLTVGNRYPRANHRLQRAATLAKVASGLHAPLAWIEQHELKQHDLIEKGLQQTLGGVMLAGAHNL